MFWLVIIVLYSQCNFIAGQSGPIVIRMDEKGSASLIQLNANGYPLNNNFPIPSQSYSNIVFNGGAPNPLHTDMPKIKGHKTHLATPVELQIANKYQVVEPIYIPVQIYGQTINALIDTGAQMSTLFESFVQQVFHRSIQSFRYIGEAKAAGGVKFHTYGPILVNATMQFGSMPLRLILSQGNPTNMLLGADFLSHPMIKAKIDYGAKTITIRGKTFPFACSPQQSFHNEFQNGSVVYDNVH